MPDPILNRELKTYNVFDFDIDFDKISRLIGPLINELDQTHIYHETEPLLHLKDLSFPMIARIPQWKGDLSWVSAASKESFQLFDSLFESLDVKNKTKDVTGVDFPMIMYSGFFIIRSFATAPVFHQDFTKNCGSSAFTLMTPVQIDETSDKGHLLYKNVFQIESKYRYKKGKAVVFGSNFLHSAEPFKSKKKYIFLCFTLGSKDMTEWKEIKKTAAVQGIAYRHPNGNINVIDPKFEKYF